MSGLNVATAVISSRADLELSSLSLGRIDLTGRSYILSDKQQPPEAEQN